MSTEEATTITPLPIVVPEPIRERRPQPRQKRRDDFELGPVLGMGAFGQVLGVQDKETRKNYAMKVLSKVHIAKEHKMVYAKVERDVMLKLNHPNILKLNLTFQDPGNLYYIIELAENGDLGKKLAEIRTIDLPEARVILGQILLGLAHMHKKRIIHRDLKPDNILLDAANRVKISDFGTAKMFSEDEEFMLPKGSFVGTADYVCPEVLNDDPITPYSDLWSFGCMLYQLLVGEAPFHTGVNYTTFKKIVKCSYTIPDFIPDDAKDLITKLLQLRPEDRLGYNDHETDYQSIREHPFFSGIDWEQLPKQEVQEFHPYKPAYVHSYNTVEPSDLVRTFLEDDEKLLKEGPIEKRVFLSVKNRIWALTTRPRLIYIDPVKCELKGQVNLTKELSVNLLSAGKWTIDTPGRKYNLACAEEGDAQAWKTAIDDVVSRL